MKHRFVTGNEGLGPPFQFTVASGFTVNVADFVSADLAVMVTAVVFVTAPVLIVKLTVWFPAGISTEDGTVATFVLLLVSDTITPPAGAGVDAVTFPVDLLPLTGAFGFIVNELSSMVSATLICGTKKTQMHIARSMSDRNTLPLSMGKETSVDGYSGNRPTGTVTLSGVNYMMGNPEVQCNPSHGV